MRDEAGIADPEGLPTAGDPNLPPHEGPAGFEPEEDDPHPYAARPEDELPPE